MYNRVELIGYVGADPEMRNTQSGKKVANLRMATSERWTDKASGEKREKTEWHRIVCFNEGIAGVIEKYVKKGSKIQVVGSLQTREWDDQQGVKRYTTEIVMNMNCNLLLLDGAEGGGNRPPPADDPDSYGKQKPRTSSQTPKDDGQGRFDDPLDDQIPF
jgi:single-strand DNA-binding protein